MAKPLRVFILSNDDLTSNIIFSPLFHSADINVVGIYYSSTLIKGSGGLAGVWKIYRRVGFKYWFYLAYSNLVFKLYCLLCSLMSRKGRRLDTISTKELAKSRGIPWGYSSDFNGQEMLEIVRKAKPDLIVIRINQILKPEILDMPKFGIWCVHSSLLPAYGGIATEFHSLRKDEQYIGSTIFQVSIELDSGVSLKQFRIKAQQNKSLFSHMVENNMKAGKLLHDSVREINENNALVPVLYNENVVPSYYSWPQPEQVRKFGNAGRSLLGFGEGLSLLLDAVLSAVMRRPMLRSWSRQSDDA